MTSERIKKSRSYKPCELTQKLEKSKLDIILISVLVGYHSTGSLQQQFIL